MLALQEGLALQQVLALQEVLTLQQVLALEEVLALQQVLALQEVLALRPGLSQRRVPAPAAGVPSQQQACRQHRCRGTSICSRTSSSSMRRGDATPHASRICSSAAARAWIPFFSRSTPTASAEGPRTDRGGGRQPASR